MAEKSELDEKAPQYGTPRGSVERRKSSVVDAAVISGEIFDERYESTQRGTTPPARPNGLG
jgi:hypothetical protein